MREESSREKFTNFKILEIQTLPRRSLRNGPNRDVQDPGVELREDVSLVGAGGSDSRYNGLMREIMDEKCGQHFVDKGTRR